MAQLASVQLPEFGQAESLPPVGLAEYRQRLDRTVEVMSSANLDFLVVYGDREHFANIAYLTGFDPRFEEALLLLDSDGRRLLLVGNECMGYLPDPGLECQVELFQEFSLLGQPRDGSRPLRKILSDFGLGKGAAVGSAGWKYFTGNAIENPERALEIPSYLADLLRQIVGEAGSVKNAGDLFMHPEYGLRVVNSADQIAQFEYASTRTSGSIRTALSHLRPGVAETELEAHFTGGGLPHSCHPMVSFGEKTRRGLSSPSHNRARIGDAFTIAYGLFGALNCRGGSVAEGPENLSPPLREFYPDFAANFFDVVSTWYEHVRVGASAGEVFQAVEAVRDPGLYSFAVNPGHFIHLDEWVNSPFHPGSRTMLRSGMALQMDIIPVSRGPFCYINAEDGIVFADETLRSEIAARHPECWERVRRRRSFMQDALGIRLDESVLPLSNIPGWLAPYALAPGTIFVRS